MKKAMIIIAVALVLGGIAVAGALGITKDASGEFLVFGMTLEEFQSYVKDKLIPLTVGIISAIGAIYVGIAPALSKIKVASGQFEQATKDVNSATGTVKENKKYVEKIENELKSEVTEIKKEYDVIYGRLDEIEHAILIAFTNQKELVANGSANRIANVIGDHCKAEAQNENDATDNIKN